jgi:hypothetical protein
MQKFNIKEKNHAIEIIKLIYQNSPDRRIRKKALDELLLEVNKVFVESPPEVCSEKI